MWCSEFCCMKEQTIFKLGKQRWKKALDLDLVTIDGADDDRNTGTSHGWVVLVKAIVRIARKKSNAYVVKSMDPVLILYQVPHTVPHTVPLQRKAAAEHTTNICETLAVLACEWNKCRFNQRRFSLWSIFFTEQAKNTALTKLLGIQQGAGFT